MWETKEALYHYSDKDRAEYHSGEKVELKHVVLDSDFFIGTWQRKDEEGIHGIYESKEEAEEHLLISNGKRYEASIKIHDGTFEGFVADFIMIDHHTGKKHNLAIFNGDYDNQDDLYICPLSPYVTGYEEAYTSASRIVVQMYDVLTWEKYKELQRNIFEYNGHNHMELQEKDFLIDLSEYVRDEYIGERLYEEKVDKLHIYHDALKQGYPSIQGWDSYLRKECEREIYVGDGKVYLMEGLEMEVEANHFQQEYFTEEAYEEIHNYIEENDLKPLRSTDGYISVLDDEDVVIYQKDEGYIGYVSDFETREKREAKKGILKNVYQELER